MASVRFETVDVFTDRRFGGNPLAVFVEADAIDDATMQALAAEMNYSETTFVLRPADPANDARVRIFNRKHEMPFAGHPMIGTAFVMARMGMIDGDTARLEIPAGIARVTLSRDANGSPVGGTVEAPQPVGMGMEFPHERIAECLQIEAGDIVATTHAPIFATCGNPYIFAEIERDVVARCTPDLAAFHRAADDYPELNGRFSLFVYAREERTLWARMFAPLAGTWEDPATGSANAPLAGLLLERLGGDEIDFTVHQGLEMGRPSLIASRAWRVGAEIRTSVSGTSVPIFSGTFEF